ncbi:esterase-like activity of phytase family protein [Nonomuraea sp. NPDC049480]|uniref:caspase, EACC1-associated type n=1 Tax=Nonomuraea sp. NPDC049480 TaxID=3364353 RepID=UPI00379869D6
MTTLPDPASSRCVIIGVSDYDGKAFAPLPAVWNGITTLTGALRDPRILGLPPEHCVMVANPMTPAELIDPVARAAAEATDTLIVYYAGHGMLDGDLKLLLTLPSSDGDKAYTGVPYDWVRRAIADNHRAQRRILILDCCYSGRSIGQMSGPSLQEAAVVEGTCLLTASARDAQALSPSGEDYTAFTGTLLNTLLRGIDGGGDHLTLDQIYRDVRQSLEARARPVPRFKDINDIGRLPFVRNQRVPLVSTDVRRPTGRTPVWGKRHAVRITSGAVVVALAAGIGAYVAWPDQRQCSAGVSLVDFSDDLDSKSTELGQVGDLSALAMVTPPDEAVALSDHDVPRVYPLALGEDGLSPKIGRPMELKQENGDSFPDGTLDGEGLAVHGNRWIVASESGPAIKMFDATSGHEVGELPVPKAITHPPDGDGITDASLESLTATPNKESLFAGTEVALDRDGAIDSGRLRILHYDLRSKKLKAQYAYRADGGLKLTELVAVDDQNFLALERYWIEDQGNTIRLFYFSLKGVQPIPEGATLRDRTLRDQEHAYYPEKRLLADLKGCPDLGATTPQTQANPLLDNIEAMAYVENEKALYLLSDDNSATNQVTRLYKLRLELPPGPEWG